MKRILIGLCGLFLVLGVVGPASATLLDFGSFPAGYGGLSWQGFNTTNSDIHAGDAALNKYAFFVLGPSYTVFPFTARTYAGENEIFDFNSGSFSANWENNLVVKVQGLLDGNLLQETSITLAYRSFNPFTFNFVGVDEVKFVLDNAGYPQYSNFQGGTGNPAYWQQQYAFSMDNLNINGPSQVPVPEPATMLLLGSGLVGLAGFGRKKLFKKA